MHVLILLGPPGSGKGTTAESVKSAVGCVYISTGDILRDAVAKNTPVGREAKEYMDRGELVPDDVMVKIVEQRLDEETAGGWFLFDGFPRTLSQAKLLDKSLAERGTKVERVFFLDAPRQILVSRLSGRRICRKCRTIYHVVNMPSKREGVCDYCGGEVYLRPDDREETVVNRLKVYTAQTEKLVRYYESQGVLVRIDSSQAREKVAQLVADRIPAR